MNHKHHHQRYRFLKEAFPILLLFLTVFIAVQKLSLHHQFYLDLYNSFPLSCHHLAFRDTRSSGIINHFGNAKSRTYQLFSREPRLLPQYTLPMVWTGAAAVQLWGLGQLPQLAATIYPEPDIGRNDSDIPL